MADFVFQWGRGVYLPNIHGHPENYEGGTILQAYGKENNRFKDIESRYLNTMKQQLLSQNIPLGAKEYINAKSIASFKEMEAELEQNLVTQYNNFVGTFESQYMSAVSTIREGAKERDKEKALRGVDDLISIFKQYDTSVNLIDTINGAKLSSPISAELADLLKIGNLIKAINNSVAREVDKNFSTITFNAALTAPAGALASMIDVLANQTANEGVNNMLEQIRASMAGRGKGISVSYTFDKDNTKQIATKSASFNMATRNISLSELANLNKSSVTVDYNLNIDSYAGVKTYTGADPHLVTLMGYRGKNSILMSELRSIYGRIVGNNQLIEYQVYNTIASAEQNSVLGENFKIIKSDILCDFAEKFIVGLDTATAQRVIIHNFTAYPILSIIASIAQQGSETIESGETYGENSIMGIEISREGLDNSWLGDQNSMIMKAKRVRKVKNFIDHISVSGRLNFKNLSSYLDPGKTQGIPLQGIVPRLY